MRTRPIPRTRRAVALGAVALALLAGACSREEAAPPAAPTTGTSRPGTSVATTVGTSTTLPRVVGTAEFPVDPSTVVPMTVTTPVPAPRAAPADDQHQASADRLNACVAQDSCAEVEAPLARWPGADLSQKDFSHSKLTGVDFRGVDLSGSDLIGANMSGADLSGARLDGATASAADFTGANLTGASLRGVDLRGADLFDAIDDGAAFTAAILCRTRWIDGTERNDSC